MNATLPPIPPPGSVARVVLWRLQLDPTLQCRVATDPEVVSRYAEAMREGAAFPPPEVCELLDHGDEGDGEVEPRLVVTDGWHRVMALREVHTEDARPHLAEVRLWRGTLREARLRAIGANADHGLQRSNADRRRTVLMLLQDEEWCQLSSRKLAEIGKISHTYVDDLRKRYGRKPGQVLDEAHRARVDGELPGPWQALQQEITAKRLTYLQGGFDKLRNATSPLDLLRVVAGLNHLYDTHQKARDLRRAELAVHPWPWPEDLEGDEEAQAAARAARVARLDTEDDLVAAAGSPGPHLAEVYEVLGRAIGISRLGEYSSWKGIEEALAGRPALLSRLAARQAQVQAEIAARPKRPYEQAEEIRAEKDPEAQARMLAEAPDEVLQRLRRGELRNRPAAFAVLRERLAGPNAAPCPDTRCSGFLAPRSWGTPPVHACVLCDQTVAGWREHLDEVRGDAAELLRQGLDIEVAGVVVDRKALELLEGLLEGSLPTKPELTAWRKHVAERKAQLAAEAAAAAEPPPGAGEGGEE